MNDESHHPHRADTSSSGSDATAGMMYRLSCTAVAVLGLAVYVMDCTSTINLELVLSNFSLVAAVVAATGLLPGQCGRGWIVVSLSIAGVANAAAVVATADQREWKFVTVLVLCGLQAAAALAAMMGERRATQNDAGPDALEFQSYAEAVIAYRTYAMQHQQPAADQEYFVDEQGAGDATASADGVTASARTDSPAQILAKYAELSDGGASQRPGGGVRSVSGPVDQIGFGAANVHGHAAQPYPNSAHSFRGVTGASES